jgi:hypothetical protein
VLCFDLTNIVSNVNKKSQLGNGVVAKNGSFGFAKGRLVCRAKPNVPFVRMAKNFKIFCAVGKKIKHEALGCSVGKRSAVKFICCPVVSIIFCQFNGCCVGLLRLPITYIYAQFFAI